MTALGELGLPFRSARVGEVTKRPGFLGLTLCLERAQLDVLANKVGRTCRQRARCSKVTLLWWKGWWGGWGRC